VLTTGFLARDTKGLDIDDSGNLVTAGYGHGHSRLYIYSGCNPGCTLVGGPFRLKSGFGHLDASSKKFIGAAGNQADVYAYSTTGIRYEYSISNGIPPSYDVSGVAFSPASQE
jgi:hypothetical protein